MTKLLNNRYQVIQVLAAGGEFNFSTVFIKTVKIILYSLDMVIIFTLERLKYIQNKFI